MGPTARETLWSAPLAKWKDRSGTLAASEVSPSVTLKLYSSRCVSVLDYTAAIVLPPDGLARQEQRIIANLLRAPFCADPHALVHHWRTIGLPSIPSLALRLQAARATATLHHRQLWSTWAAKLHEQHGDIVALATVLGGALCYDVAHQSTMYNMLLAAQYGSQLDVTLAARIRTVLSYVFPAGAIGQETLARAISRVCKEAKWHSPIFVLHAVRTWCNAWSTSFRTQTGSAGCVWGCSPIAVDSLHLLALRNAVGIGLRRFGTTPPPPRTSRTSMGRAGGGQKAQIPVATARLGCPSIPQTRSRCSADAATRSGVTDAWS